MCKKILSLDLGITSIGYSVLNQKDTNRYELIDYGVTMFDSPYDKDGKTKKSIHSALISSKKLNKLRKERKHNLAKIFEKYNLSTTKKLIENEKNNKFKNKWDIRCKYSFERKLEIDELFSALYHIAKHRGYKSLDTDDLLEELMLELGFEIEDKKKKDEEKGKIKEALKRVEQLKQQYPNKTVAQIIYEIESQKDTPTFRNHDNYNYMIRREEINEEIKIILKNQNEFGLFGENFDIDSFIKEIISTIDDQKEPTNDLSLFGRCQYFKDKYVTHQYSLLSDIYKFYESVANINFNKNIKISKEQINALEEWLLAKIKKGKNIKEIRYKDIREALKLSDDYKIFNKEDIYINKKGKREHLTITKFYLLSNLKEYKDLIIEIINKDNWIQISKEIFEILQFEKSPKTQFENIKEVLEKYNIDIKNEDIINLIKLKSGKSLNISSYAMIKFIPYFKRGYDLTKIKDELNLNISEDYSKFKKGIKYLHITTYEKDDNLEINNHAIKYVVSAVLRLVKHLHTKYGTFDEIKVESSRDLSLNDEAKKAIESVNKENEKRFNEVLANEEYQKIAKDYNVNLKKYVNKILLWQEQNYLDIYSGKTIAISDIFENKVDIDHIVPRSLGGLSVKHNLVLVYKDSNLQKSNRLPMDFVDDKEAFVNRVENLFKEFKINWKKRKNLLATSLDETYKDTFESKSLRATSYVEALTANILKRYYPFNDIQKQKDGSSVRHIQGRATSNIRRLLNVKTKIRDTNLHHAIDAILIGVTNHSWLQKISTAFKDNYGKIEEEAIANIKKIIPYIDGLEIKDLVEEIEKSYNIYGENDIFYKDIFGNIKSVYYWVSKKSDSSKLHKDTIYGIKNNGIYTSRVNIKDAIKNLNIKYNTKPQDFEKKFTKDILEKMYLHITNKNDYIYQAIKNRGYEIKSLLEEFTTIDKKNKEQIEDAKNRLSNLLNQDILDNNGNVIRRVKFYQTNLTGLPIRGGLAIKEKNFIGLRVTKNCNKLDYSRIDMINRKKINKLNDSSLKFYKNDIIFFILKDGSFKGGKLVSFVEKASGSKECSFQNPRYPANVKKQPKYFVSGGSTKYHAIKSAIGVLKINLDILGNIKSYQKIGNVPKETIDKILYKV